LLLLKKYHMNHKDASRVSSNVFDSVIVVGPNLNDRGGITSVINSYRAVFPAFHYLPTNSGHGFVCGAFVLGTTLVRLPFARLFKRRRLLHVHVASGKSFFRKSLIVAWGRILGYKIILHCHSGLIKDYAAARGADSLRPTFDKASTVVALTESWREYYRSTFGCRSVDVINNIVAPAEVKNFPPRRSEGPLHLLFLGKICEAKGIFDLLELMEANASRWRDRVRLVVGGNGETERLQEEIRRLGISDLVDFVGWVDGTRKEELLSAADLMILPSYAEGLPVTILEAMAHGIPAIASDVGGIPEMMADGITGTIHAPGDRKAIADAIDFYLCNPGEITRRGKAALDSVVPYYPDRVLKSIEELYNKALS